MTPQAQKFAASKMAYVSGIPLATVPGTLL
jgi:hypothetical protein